jgi:hypothetical protein
LRARETQPLGQASNAEASAAFSATRADNGAPATRPHPNKKTVRPLAADHRGLKRSLHLAFPRKRKTRY